MVGHQRRQPVAGGLGVVEVPLGVGLQVHGELVEMLGHLVIVVEVLIKVDLAVSVQVVKPDDLVAAADVDLALDDLQSQRLEQARGDPPPGQALLRPVDALDDPDVAIPGAHRRGAAIGQEVEAREPELAEPRIGRRGRSACRRRTARRRGRRGPGRQPLGPAAGPPRVRERERFGRRRMAGEFVERSGAPRAHQQLELERASPPRGPAADEPSSCSTRCTRSRPDPPSHATAVPAGATQVSRSWGERPMFERSREDRPVRSARSASSPGVSRISVWPTV